jgi:CubicO group peptidase (beta-lactamase class C family)
MRPLRWSALLVLAACGADRPATARSDTGRIDRVLTGLRPGLAIVGEPAVRWSLADRMRAHHVPGAGIAVIDSGRIVWTRMVGVREAGAPAPVDSVTLFQAGSISKAVFSLAAMKLVERGLLSLDEDVNQKLRSWRVPSNRFTDSTKVTLRRLLSHTAGLTVHGFPGYPAGAPLPTVQQVLDGARPANTAPVRVDTFPGSISRYSGGGTTVAMVLATEVSGKSFPELMRELVLEPAGMTRSTYEQPLPASKAADAATGHTVDGTPVAGRFHTYPEMSAAGLWTTPGDLARLVVELGRIHRGSSSPLIDRAALDTMFTPQVVADNDFGIGFETKGRGRDLEISHGGSVIGFRAEMVGFPERGQGAVVMTNGDGGDELIAEILASVAEEYDWPSRHPIAKTVVKKDSTELRALAGEYLMAAGVSQRITALVTVEGDKLFLSSASGLIPRTELLAESDSTFFSREGNLTVAFRRSGSGPAKSIEIDGIRGARIR